MNKSECEELNSRPKEDAALVIERDVLKRSTALWVKGIPALCAWVARRYASAMRVRYIAAAMGMAIAIPFMAPVPAYAGTTVFSDNFATQNNTLWHYFPAAYISSGQLVLPTHASYDGQIISRTPYDFTDCAFTVQFISPPPIGNGTTETGPIVSSLNTDVETTSAYYMWLNGNLTPSQTVNWNPTYYTNVWGFTGYPWWLRIRHSSVTGLLTFERSQDGTTWTVDATVAPVWDVRTSWLFIQSGWWGSETNPGPAIYGNVSLVHNVPVPPPPPP